MPGSNVVRALRFLPYRFAENAIELEVTQCLLDGAKRPGVAIDGERRLVALNGQRFSKVTLELTVAVPNEVLVDVLPPEEREASPVAVLAVVTCEQSRFRGSFVLPAIAGGSFGGTVEDREDLFGAVEMTGCLVRAAPASIAGKGWAEERGARLASARTWELRFEIAPVANSGVTSTWRRSRGCGGT